MFRRPPAAAIAAALLTGVVALPAAPATAACEQPTMARAAAAADVVFAGPVESSEQVQRAGERRREVSVAVDRVYQGEIGRRTATVTMPLTENPLAGDEWFFFVDGADAQFTAGECSGSQPVTDRTTRLVEDELGAGEVVVDPAPPREPLAYEQQDVGSLPSLSRILAPGAALILIALLGLVLTRRRD